MKRDYVIVEGKNYEEVLKSGLSDLKLKKDEVEIEVLKEQKSSLFKKSYIQLRLTVKQDKEELELIKKAQDINVEIEETVFKSDKLFYISYLLDGVYITINQLNKKDNNENLTIEILEYLDKKSVQEVNTEEIKRIVREKDGNPTKIAPQQEEVTIDGEALVEVSKDKLQAYITITEADGGKVITLNDAMEKLYQYNIKHGVDYDKLKNIIGNNILNEKVLIAEGKKAIDGKDGSLIYHFDMTKKHQPQILEDGSVDFKQLDLITNVHKGDILIEIQSPIEGTEGVNVLGEKIPPQKGKAPKILIGKNIIESKDGLKLYANLDGQVFYRDGKIEVNQVYEIPGDVDNSTGNIKFNGKVVVRGSVKSGFVVDAQGDIEVNGVVEGATLIARDNIILNRGVQGNNQAYLQCDGDLIAKYIENTRIKVSGNIQADCIMHSIVVSKGNVIVSGRRGLVVGGQVKVAEEIVAKIIGSNMGTSTIIEVGIDPDEKQRYDSIKKEITKIEENLSNLKKTIELLNKANKSSKLQENKEEILVKSLKTYEYLKDKYENLLNELNTLEIKMQNLSKGKIHVSNKLYPGVKVAIQNAVRHIHEEIPICTLYKKEGEIVIGPYEK
ncbi:MAG: FapA family protein [Clostridiaceae bacterium]|nr:FapA family protein [Clostridiaceae bacterium]